MLIEPLHNFLECFYICVRQRTKRAEGIFPAAMGWNSNYHKAFGCRKCFLATTVVHAKWDIEKHQCFYTHASDTVWSAIVPQVFPKGIALYHFEQRHRSLGFLSGRFYLIQLGCLIRKKKSFAVMDTADRMNWIAATTAGFDIYADRNNLLF